MRSAHTSARRHPGLTTARGSLHSNKTPDSHKEINQEAKLLLKKRKKGKTNDEFILKKQNKIEDMST